MPLGSVRWNITRSNSGRLCHSANPLLLWPNSHVMSAWAAAKTALCNPLDISIYTGTGEGKTHCVSHPCLLQSLALIHYLLSTSLLYHCLHPVSWLNSPKPLFFSAFHYQQILQVAISRLRDDSGNAVSVGIGHPELYRAHQPAASLACYSQPSYLCQNHSVIWVVVWAVSSWSRFSTLEATSYPFRKFFFYLFQSTLNSASCELE